MNIDSIKKAIETCLKNNKELVPFIDVFSLSLNTFLSKFDEYQLEPDYENFCSKLSEISIEYTNDGDLVVFESNNKMLINIQKVKHAEDPDEIERMFNKSILKMFTNVNNIETGRSEGIIFEHNNKKYGTYINEKIDDRVLELFFGNSTKTHIDGEKKVETIELPTASDQICYDMESLVGYENLFIFYLNGRGDLFFNKLSGLFNSEEECISFISKVDDLKENNSKKDDEYFEMIEKLFKKKKELDSSEFKF